MSNDWKTERAEAAIKEGTDKIMKAAQEKAKQDSKFYECKKKIFDVKLETLDPTGVATKTEELSMEVIDDENCMKHERLFIHIGECLYYVDKKGFIIDRVVPLERMNKEILIEKILNIINSENSGLSHQQRLNEIESLLKKV